MSREPSVGQLRTLGDPFLKSRFRLRRRRPGSWFGRRRQLGKAGEWTASRRRGLRVGAGNKKGQASREENLPLQFPNPIEDRKGLRGTVAASANRPVASGGEAESTWASRPAAAGFDINGCLIACQQKNPAHCASSDSQNVAWISDKSRKLPSFTLLLRSLRPCRQAILMVE